MFEFFFKYPLTVFQKGEFLFLSGWPAWLLIVLIAAAATGLAWHVRRNGAKFSPVRLTAIWALEAALMALLFVLLWHPAVRVATLRPQENVIAVLVDTSHSMGLKESTQSRLDKVQAALNGGLLRNLSSRFQVRVYDFSAGLERVEDPRKLVAQGHATRLGEAVAGVLRETSSLPLGGVVVFSDGADNSNGLDRGLMSEIRQRRIPIHTVGVGRTEIPYDVELTDVAVSSRALPGSRLIARVSLRQHGLGGQKARLAVREGANILAARDITLNAGQTVQTEEIVFNSGNPGARKLTFVVDPLPNEEVTGNNFLTRVLQVVPGKRRILYVEGEPRWDFKFIRRAAEDDQSIQLITLLRTSANKFYRQNVDNDKMLADGFPASAADLFGYQALIIGTIEAQFFTPSQQELIKEFVNRRGGSVLFVGGRHSFSEGGWATASLAEILPVRLTPGGNTFHRRPVKVQLTQEGRESLICRLDEDPQKNLARWDKLPDLADYQTTGELKPGAVSLIEAQLPGSKNIPMLAVQNYGRGHTMVLATGGDWRWKMRLDHTDSSHVTFWQQLLRSMVAGVPGPVTVTSDRVIYSDEDRVHLRAEARTQSYEPANNATVVATLTGEDGAPSTIEFHPSAEQEGVYEADLAAEKTGSYRLEVTASRETEVLGRESVVFHREDGVAESFHPEQNRELLQKMAQQTGGKYWDLSEVSKLPSEITYSEAGITARETRDLWDMPVVFLLALALLASEWLLRRKWGTV
jgi:uncharacterized membrane protein